ncbi:MAG: hypothetical protein RIA65_02545 [Woeseia sp.]
MRFIHVYRIARSTPLALILLASGSVLSAQESADNNVVTTSDDELQPITITDPRYSDNFADEDPLDDELMSEEQFAEPLQSPDDGFGYFLMVLFV